MSVNDLYSEVPIMRPPIKLVESVLNREQVSLMRPIGIENCITSGRNSVSGFNFKWS